MTPAFTLRCAAVLLASAAPQLCAAPLRFDFGAGAIATDTLYSHERGYGFEPGANVTVAGGGVTSAKPFHFTMRVPAEG
ncbi:MAG TPA: hypothetical protein VM029_17650, partial [Opitutaceae bacterium]|nr:hypothetical protein [Opitutaceae bacterium]